MEIIPGVERVEADVSWLHPLTSTGMIEDSSSPRASAYHNPEATRPRPQRGLVFLAVISNP
jgi:hypothetical protein